MNSVGNLGVGVNSGVNPGVNPGVNLGVNNNKKSNIGAKVGACVGIATGITRTIMKREIIRDLGDSLILAGKSKAVARSSQVLGIALGIGLMAGLGALVGKGVEGLINHFKKDKPKGVIPGKNPNPPKKTEGDPFEKYRKGQMLRTYKSGDGGEYVIQDGHPKTIYRKDPKTGGLTLVSSVYDGSWGSEMSDENLIASLKNSKYKNTVIYENSKPSEDVKASDYSDRFKK